MEYLLHVLVLIGLYIILAVSLDMVAGQVGMLSMAHAAFYAVGAYVAALMALRLHTGFLLNVVCAAALGAVLGTVIGRLAGRLRGDSFVITTFAFQVIVSGVLTNWISVTQGPYGLPGIPRPDILRWHVESLWAWLLLVTGFCAVTVWAAWRMCNSPFGRVLRAIREDEVFSQAAGKDVASFKRLAFAVSAAFAAVAGALYACYVTYIDPTSFTITESIFMLAVVIIGGAGTLWGPVLGAVVLVAAPELFRLAGVAGPIAANIRQMLYGLLLIGFMLWRPTGLLRGYPFRKESGGR